jgi:hypothetical protein
MLVETCGFGSLCDYIYLCGLNCGWWVRIAQQERAGFAHSSLVSPSFHYRPITDCDTERAVDQLEVLFASPLCRIPTSCLLLLLASALRHRALISLSRTLIATRPSTPSTPTPPQRGRVALSIRVLSLSGLHISDCRRNFECSGVTTNNRACSWSRFSTPRVSLEHFTTEASLYLQAAS